jgi:hypothetical protein
MTPMQRLRVAVGHLVKERPKGIALVLWFDGPENPVVWGVTEQPPSGINATWHVGPERSVTLEYVERSEPGESP